jgi:hypothetical protein
MNEDISFSSFGKISMSWILFSLNVRKVLSYTLVLTRDGLVFRQPLNYEGIPFKCRRCHEHEGIPFYDIWVKRIF